MRIGVGGHGPTACATIFVSKSEWEQLSEQDRLAFITWMKAQIPKIRANPGFYLKQLGIPTSAPAYKYLFESYQQMREGSFAIYSLDSEVLSEN